MGIQLLSEQLASQIAAGEVVERPASVVKELVENALDAGATTINIDIKRGGRDAIQIADNGHGIPADQVETAFLRHATSKLQHVDELEAIGTLGFRGEALAAIAAVSQVTVITRIKEDPAGVRLTMDGGVVTGRDKVGAPSGTVIAVDNLFFNTPARLKFLKTVATEKRLIDEFVTKYALAYPAVRFRLTHDGRVTFQTSGSGELRDVLVAVYGAELARQFMGIGEREGEAEGEEGEEGEGEEFWGDDGQSKIQNSKSPINVFGFAAPPSQHRANRNHITLFVNGRWIKDKNLTYAIIQAYHTLLPSGRYPLAVVFVQMPLEQVDVNVHPTKTEVRFRESGRVFGAVQKSVREAIIADTPVRSVGTFAQLTGRPTWGNSGQVQKSFTRQGAGETWGQGEAVDWGWLPEEERNGQMGLGLSRPESPGLPLGAAVNGPAQAPALHLAGEKLPIMRVVGQVGASYIITEGPEGIFLVDQHAAHERIMYEKFLAAHAQKALASQGLVAGTAIHLTPDQATLLEDNLQILGNLGFAVEPFGPNAFMIRAVPAFIATQDPVRIVADVVADLERGDNPTQQKVEDKIIRRVCKTASIKQGQVLSKQEMEALIQQLEACANPHTCPHGRPTLIYLSVGQLAKEFGRT